MYNYKIFPVDDSRELVNYYPSFSKQDIDYLDTFSNDSYSQTLILFKNGQPHEEFVYDPDKKLNYRSNRLYLCVKDSKGEYQTNLCDFDLLALIIDEYGNLTDHWQHLYYSNPILPQHQCQLCKLSEKQIEFLFNIDFKKIFIPFTEEQLKERGVLSFKEFEKQLQTNEKKLLNDYSISDCLYNRFYRIRLNNKDNIYDKFEKQLVFKQWADNITYDDDTFIIQQENKWSIFDKDLNFISKTWLIENPYFHCHFALLKNDIENYQYMDNKGNFINIDYLREAKPFNPLTNSAEIEIHNDEKIKIHLDQLVLDKKTKLYNFKTPIY